MKLIQNIFRPLHKAMRNRYVKIILANALLKRGALPNEITNEGKTRKNFQI